MTKRVAIMLDGGYLRQQARQAKLDYKPNIIEQIGLSCATPGEEIYRILYYDCASYNGTVTLPVSKQKHEFKGNDHWLVDLSKKDLFAVRRGDLKFRGYVLKHGGAVTTPAKLTDADFEPTFEQKGVDMRIGLDIAVFSDHRTVDLIVIATNDTDFVPAMKHARRCGMQIALITFAGCKTATELLAHSDFHRKIKLPATPQKLSSTKKT